MPDSDRTRRIHELDPTVRVGKRGPKPVATELHTQLETTELVKVKFLQSSLGGTDAETLADELAEMAGADVLESRGHTAVFE